MSSIPSLKEEVSAKLPALAMLINLGWKYVSPKQAMILRNDNRNNVILHKVLREELSKRTFSFEGQEHTLSQHTVSQLIDKLIEPVNSLGLLQANETITNHLRLGIAVTEFINGRKANPTIALIDWKQPENNSFIVTEEFTVLRTDQIHTRRPDIVCFVNGIPFIVIEAKRPDLLSGDGILEGISQNIRNQKVGEIQNLFAYSQILMSVDGTTGKYGTCETPEVFWSKWEEEELEKDQLTAIKNKPIAPAQLRELLCEHSAKEAKDFKRWFTQPKILTGQDTILASLASPARLLEMTKYFILFSDKSKIIARYQQYFGIKRIFKRITHVQHNGQREGGVIWHTTGTGKSYTMVFMCQDLVQLPQLKQCRILVITDRKELEKQLSKTFHSCGEGSMYIAKTGTDLARNIEKGTNRVTFSIIDKFGTAIKNSRCHNDSADIIVLVDEAHRSQGGENYARMRGALPHAAFVGFTGTPLLKNHETMDKFGSIIHAYPMQKAVADGMVTPLLYEERKPNLDENGKAIDADFERITAGLTPQHKEELKKRFARANAIYHVDDRIRIIAEDLVAHFENNVGPKGLKAMLACDSQEAAVTYKKYLDEAGFKESAIVMSHSDTRKDHASVHETNKVQDWWDKNIGNTPDDVYAKKMVDRFEKDPKLKLLIVVEKLLTGFDEPLNTVLYIDKPLKEHKLLQAIARVNRLHPDKEYGLLVDYRGILKELDTTLESYNELDSDYKTEDIKGLYRQMGREYTKLPKLYKALWSIFDNVVNKDDPEQMRQYLMPISDSNGQDKNQKRREDFYEALRNFTSCLQIALQSVAFYQDTEFTENDRNNYKNTLKYMDGLRRMVMADTGEAVNFHHYDDKMKKLLDRHISGVDIKEPQGAYVIDPTGSNRAVTKADMDKWSEDKKKNESELIRSRITKKIDDIADDPYAKKKLSEDVRNILEEMQGSFDFDKNFLHLQKFEKEVDDRKIDGIPQMLQKNPEAQAYYGIFRLAFPDLFIEPLSEKQQKKWTDFALTTQEIVTKARNENGLNQKDMEKAISRGLRQAIRENFQDNKEIKEHRKQLIEEIIQNVRVRYENTITH